MAAKKKAAAINGNIDARLAALRGDFEALQNDGQLRRGGSRRSG